MARIDAAPAGDLAAPRAARWVRALAVAAVLQTVAVAGLLALVWNQSNGSYETLSSSAPGAVALESRIEVALMPQTTLAELPAIVQASGWQLADVDGPSLRLAPRADSRVDAATALQRLRSDARVLGARLIAGGAR